MSRGNVEKAISSLKKKRLVACRGGTRGSGRFQASRRTTFRDMRSGTTTEAHRTCPICPLG